MQYASIDISFRLKPKSPQNFAVKSAHFGKIFALKLCVAICHPAFLTFHPWTSQKQQPCKASCEAAPYRSEHTSLLFYTKVRSRGNTLMDASFCVAKEAASVLPNKRLQNSDDFRRHKLHSSPLLFVKYFGSNESLQLSYSEA